MGDYLERFLTCLLLYIKTVSYTHLDVYKRQLPHRCRRQRLFPHYPCLHPGVFYNRLCGTSACRYGIIIEGRFILALRKHRILPSLQLYLLDNFNFFNVDFAAHYVDGNIGAVYGYGAIAGFG